MMTRRALIAAAPAGCALVLLPATGRAETAPVYAEGGVAIDGIDPTSYFTQAGPVPGEPGITLDWRGATWRFTSEAARAAFEREPERYAPRFGGWCAWAVAEGYTAPTAPDAWTIVDGRLYLNYSRAVRRRWERDVAGNIARAEANWPGVLD
jgi:hypothetical protein